MLTFPGPRGSGRMRVMAITGVNFAPCSFCFPQHLPTLLAITILSVGFSAGEIAWFIARLR